MTDPASPGPPPRPLALLLASLLLAAGGTASARAQESGHAAPDPFARRDAQHARYVARVRESLSDLLGRWAGAWQRGDLSDLVGLYSERCVVHLPGGGATAWGTGELKRLVDRKLPVAREVSVSLGDLDVADRLAFVSGAVRYRISANVPGGGRTVTETFVMVFRRSGSTWRIRSHLFRPSG